MNINIKYLGYFNKIFQRRLLLYLNTTLTQCSLIFQVVLPTIYLYVVFQQVLCLFYLLPPYGDIIIALIQVQRYDFKLD